MEERPSSANRVILMDGGKILLEGSPQDLVARRSAARCRALRLDDEVRTSCARPVGGSRVEERLYIYDRNGGGAAPRSNGASRIDPG